MAAQTKSEERILAVISHLSALAFGVGPFLPVILWSENRRKSGGLRFQALQAAGYQSLGYTVWALACFLLFMLWMIALFFVAALVPNAAQNDTISMVFAVLLMVFMLGMVILYLIIPVLGAIFCGIGWNFRYPILGRGLEHFLGEQVSAAADSPNASLDSASEEHFIAAMGHFAVILPIWGALTPAYLWLNHSKHSAWLKFQSAQTAIYQLLVNLFYLGAIISSIGLGLLALFVFSVFFDLGEWLVVAGMMVMIGLLSVAGLIVPVFHILGQWAGLRVLQGQDFRYPLLGALVERWTRSK